MQGKCYTDQGEDETASGMFRSIADLEDEWDVRLLTDADPERLRELSG